MELGPFDTSMYNKPGGKCFIEIRRSKDTLARKFKASHVQFNLVFVGPQFWAQASGYEGEFRFQTINQCIDRQCIPCIIWHQLPFVLPRLLFKPMALLHDGNWRLACSHIIQRIHYLSKQQADFSTSGICQYSSLIQHV